MILQKLHLLKSNISKRGKKFTISVTLLLFIGFCCFGIFALAIIDVSLREIGLLPTYTASPLASSTDTPSATLPVKTSTNTPVETLTIEPTKPPSPTGEPTATEVIIEGPRVVIKGVNKVAEYVDLENIGNQPQDITGWRLVSEKGDQACILAGTIEPGETLRVWAGNDVDDGFNCNYTGNIWNNSEPDPAVLYNNQGVEIDRYP